MKWIALSAIVFLGVLWFGPLVLGSGRTLARLIFDKKNDPEEASSRESHDTKE